MSGGGWVVAITRTQRNKSISSYEGTFSIKISFIELGAFPDFVLYITVRSNRRFLCWTDAEF